MSGIRRFAPSLVLAIAALAAPAHAGPWDWLRTAPLERFEDSDWDRVQDTAARALDGAVEGDVLEWRNDDTGNSGAVGVLLALELDGHACKALELVQRVADGEAGRFRSLLCRVDGNWLTVSPTAANEALARER